MLSNMSTLSSSELFLTWCVARSSTWATSSTNSSSSTWATSSAPASSSSTSCNTRTGLSSVSTCLPLPPSPAKSDLQFPPIEHVHNKPVHVDVGYTIYTLIMHSTQLPSTPQISPTYWHPPFLAAVMVGELAEVGGVAPGDLGCGIAAFESDGWMG